MTLSSKFAGKDFLIMKKLFLLLFLFSAGCFCAQVKNVNAAEFKKLIDEKKYVLIDLRTSEEIQKKGMIKGAQQIDFLAKDAEATIEKLDHNTPYLIYCAGGGRSSDCAALMQKQGFKTVVNLEKGFSEWTAKGLEVEKK
jgi:rhodanese-related sulfurtransferase